MRARALGALLLGAFAACAPDAPPPAANRAAPGDAAGRAYRHVLLVSVDGLRPDALPEAGSVRLPALGRLLAGAATRDARTDPDWTVTLPNHLGMITGRLVEGREGHHWRRNDLPAPADRLRPGVATAWHVAAAAGARCALFASKEKFVLLPRSCNGRDAGAADGPLHEYAFLPEAADVCAAVTGFWTRAGAARTLAFAHLREPDAAGHEHGWDPAPESAYAAAVARADAALAAIFAFLDADPARRADTAILLTTDHGGGVPLKNHHGEGRAAANYVIPFAVWTGDGRARGDLYALNEGRRAAPGARDPRPGDPGPPPIRNSDAANLALALLGLPPVPGSTVNARQDLRVAPPAAP